MVSCHQGKQKMRGRQIKNERIINFVNNKDALPNTTKVMRCQYEYGKGARPQATERTGYVRKQVATSYKPDEIVATLC